MVILKLEIYHLMTLQKEGMKLVEQDFMNIQIGMKGMKKDPKICIMIMLIEKTADTEICIVMK